MQPVNTDPIATPTPEPTAPTSPPPVEPTPIEPTPGIQNTQPGYQPPAETPAPVETPQPQEQPTAPVEDPFADLFKNDAPTGNTPQATPTPSEPAQPQPTAPEQIETYEQKVERALASLPPVPEAPKLSSVNADSPEEVETFFKNWAESIKAEVRQEGDRARVFQNMEAEAWQEAFNKYPTLKSDRSLRDTVHALRVGNHSSGVYQTPLQAAESLLTSLNKRYKEGVTDSNVISTIESSQPTGGASNQPTPVSGGIQDLLSVQDGGATALTSILTNRINNGQL